jgi:hypothetical protein
LGFNSDDDCKKNNLYFDRKSFSENIKVPFYLDNSNPRKCVSRHNNYKKLTEYCKEIKDVESVYWSSTKECKIPKNGAWIKEPVFDSSCTRNGIDGDKIVCGGGSQIEKKYVYNKPEIDLAVKLFDPNKIGKDVDPPAETTEYLINGKRVAYKFKSCSNNKCKDLCKRKYGQIQDSAYLDKSKDIELPLSLPDLNDNTYCKKDVKQSVSINLPSEVCPSCGNYNKEKINRNWTCLDGFARDSKITKCAEPGTDKKNEVV